MEYECPFWAQQRMCNSNKCAICECTENEIPSFWKSHQQKTEIFDHRLSSTSKDCPTTGDEWCAEEEHDPKSVYVNLEKNKESYTAYEGMQIWKAIYQENCMIEKFKELDVSKTCSEETLLYQLISGMHASVNMHVSKNFYDQKTNYATPNHAMYLNVIGQHEDRLKNLYFLFAVVLRAVNRAAPMLRAYDYETQINQEEDLMTPQHVNQLIEITLSHCEEPFKEKNLFISLGNDFRQEVQLKEIQTKFYNISRILDCVSCEKCRLNGKVQIKGIGTAMKLLFSTNVNSQQLQLKRTEIIALLNTLYKLSESLEFYQEFIKFEQSSANQMEFLKYIVSCIILILIFIVDRTIKSKSKVRSQMVPSVSQSGKHLRVVLNQGTVDNNHQKND
ncbi:endoplasmic oxidoreductin-1 [Stylonychia lemnae]|uniref:Endoplasmic oxidoreductin-1 n=1 Tax=Stylonychia lemnae TaxID=5949 RepID=A0A078AJU6_STYLE|nr:endoplasmic oxidoreductin-1 [Stylonychia lemnae]|eukprot:CDW82655.1 endoplasmic oxidoreductin-1 [Stylonychia lemnae]